MGAKTRKLTVCLDEYSFELLRLLAARAERSLSYTVAEAIESRAMARDGLGKEWVKKLQEKEELKEIARWESKRPAATENVG